MHLSSCLLLLGCLLISGCASQFGVRDPQLRLQASEPQATTPAVGEFPSSGVISEVELQRELQAFADRYIQRIMQASDDALQSAESPAEREAIDLFKASSTASAISIATSANPLHGLRDMRVLVGLQERVWRDGGPKQLAPERAAEIHRQLQALEQQLRLLAARVIPQAAMQELDQRTERWHVENPKLTSVAFIRFQNLDLANSNLEQVTSSSGLLAPVAEAVREVHETRKMAERALFLVNHMPMLMQLRGELLSDRVLDGLHKAGYLEEVRKLRATLQQISSDREAIQQELELYRPMIRELSEDIERLPQHMTNERVAIFQSLESGAEAYQPILAQLNSISSAARDATLSLERIQLQGAREEQMSNEEVFALLDKLLLLTERASGTIDTLSRLLQTEPGQDGQLVLDRLLAEHLRRIFAYAAMLMILMAALVVLVRYYWVRSARQSAG